MDVNAIKHITVALDGSPASESAVRYGCELARAGASLSFCNFSQNEEAANREALCEAAIVQARALGIKAGRHDSPLQSARAIADCARENASEAIVIGSDERHGFAHLRESIGESLMRIAGRPVIFVHQTDEYRGGDIAVTISGYDTSHAVLDAAIAIAMALDRSLLLISEITIPRGSPYYAPGTNSDARLAAAAKRASAASVKSTISIGDGIGSIPTSLIELAKQRDCAMIVTGLHDRSGLERFFNGSIAEQLVLEAHVPVAVVHHASQPDPV